jgi:hypothetical protein
VVTGTVSRSVRAAGRWHRFIGSVLVGWCVFLAALMQLGCPLEVAWFGAVFAVGVVGFPLLYRAWGIAGLACAAVLAMGAGFGALHQDPQPAAHHVAEHPK